MSITATGLSNEVIGGKYLTQGGIRFQAHHSSPLAAFRCYIINNASGYSGGTGGSMSVDLRTDNSGFPDIGITSGVPVPDPEFPNPTSGKGYFPLVQFDRSFALSKDAWYWLVVKNIDPNPIVNYFSLDFLTGPASQVVDTAIYVGTSGSWKLVSYLIPSPVVLHYANGLYQGLGWIAVNSNGSLECGQQYGFPQGSCI